jgi:hypothetical protein
MQYLSSADRIDRELIAEFLITFSRAEYALKAAEFVYPVADRADGRFDVAWDRFADEIAGALLQSDLGSDPAIRYLMDKPPQKQVLTARGLKWKPRSRHGQSPARFLVRSVTTVRNNLFHGAKEPLVERDRQLVRGALRALKLFISLHEEVFHAFQEIGPKPRAA